jgi:2,5-dioxopentanoate dehydrogenase
MATTLQAVDPRTGERGPSYDAAGPADVGPAAEAAAAAARHPALADDARRADGLRAVAAALEARGDEIVEVCQAETGLPEGRLRGELVRTCLQLSAFAGFIAAGEHLGAIIDLPDPDAKPAPRPDLRRILVPVGPVAVFGASNFPLAFSTMGGDTAAALAAGCPVVVKGHPSHPGTGALVAEIARDALASAGLPDGTFAHLLSGENAVGEALVDHPAIEAVAFTGSFHGGSALVARAARRDRPIPVYAEMGSLNPFVVTEAALRERSAEIAGALAGAIATFAGQMCTKPGLVFVPSGAAGDAFARELAGELAAREAEAMLSESIHAGFTAGIAELGDVERLTPETEAGGEGFRHPPVAFRVPAGELTARPGLAEEHFGPAGVVAVYDDLDEVPALLEALGGQLTVTIHAAAGDAGAIAPVVAAATRLAGRVLFGGVPTGVAVTWAMTHGGPWPATSAAGTTSVGLTAIERFQRPVTYQSAPEALLPPALRDGNPLGVPRRVNGVLGHGHA